MPVKSSTRVSKLTVQPLKPELPPSTVGSLPTVDTLRPEVPEVVTQGDAYFSRDSIGSAKFDSRMDFPKLPSNASPLSKPITAVDRKISLSPQRPYLLASVDVFSPVGTNKKKIAQAIDESLEVSNFNYQLLESDYEYVYSSLKSSDSTSAIMQDLEDTATSNLSKNDEVLAAISSLSSARETFSQNLDIRLSWDNVGEKIAENYATFATKFGDTQIDTSLETIGINSQVDTGTAIIKRVQALVTRAADENKSSSTVGSNVVGLSKGYFAVDNRVANTDLLFDEGTIKDYSDLTRLGKVAACSEFLSRVFTDTFTGMTGSAQIDLPTIYSGSSIFEPQKLQRGSAIIPSHYDGIIDPAIKNLSTANIDTFNSEVVKKFNDSYESAKMKTGVQNANEAGSPLDIYLRLIGKVKDSFPTLYTSIETASITNPSEIYDAVNMLFAMKQQTSTSRFNGFMRGVLLTNLLDPDFVFLSDSGEEYDSVNQSEAQVEDSVDGSRTVKSKTGNKQLETKTLTDDAESPIVNSVFNYSERLKNFPEVSRGYTKLILGYLGQSAPTALTFLEYSVWLVNTFDPTGTDYVKDWRVDVAPEYEGWDKNAPRANSIPESIKSALPQGYTIADAHDATGVSGEFHRNLTDRISTFGRDDTGKTVANSIIDFYDEIVAVFEEVYGKKLDEVSTDGNFYTRDGTCTKRGIIDVIFECMGNLVSHFLSPGFFVDNNQVTQPLSAGGRSSRVTTTSTYGYQYLSVNSSFYETLAFCESISQVQGDLSTAISAAYESSNLASTTDTRFYSDVVSSVISDLYPRHKGTRVAIASIAGISNIIDSACQNFNKSITDATAPLSSLSSEIRSDILQSITTEVASAILLKQRFEYGVKQPLEESLSIYDINATKWFYKNYSDDLSTDKTCLIAGLPSGFIDEISRASVQVTGDRVIAGGTLPSSRNLSRFKILSSSRSISKPFEKLVPLFLGRFHPLVHVYITSNFENNLLPLDIAATGGVTILCFDRGTASWVETSYEDCIDFLTNGGNFGVSGDSQATSILSNSEVEEIIEFHVLDAILKSVIRVTCGVNFEATSLCSPSRVIDSIAAPKILSLFSAASPNIIPTGGLSASDYLSANSDGTYTPLPFSLLAGQATGLTDPSTHSLLLKLLGSGIFTSGEITKRIVTPPAFERVYCMIHDPSRLVSQDKSANLTQDPAYKEVTLASIGVTAE